METHITRIVPEECIANIISNTSPRDACRLSLVSRGFKIAAASNLVWERFLPPDHWNIICVRQFRQRQRHRHHHPPPFNAQTFAINKWSGKKCYMLGARELSISWGDTEYDWQWISSSKSPGLPKSGFSEVAHLWLLWWLEIIGSVETKILSPNTTYGVYFIYTIAQLPKNNMYFNTSPYGLFHPMKVSLSIENDIEGETTNIAYLQPRTSRDRPPGQEGRLPCKREDMWMETENWGVLQWR
ncbi:F-box protein At2g02240-like [Carya illinoinensis]|uniref:F-box protein At2g02240-like n=1 Tax=Carya illinoinensis TaxID=32201 RepID=UPI001C71A871|nr:F-box protein At2g02240-like [Carya illinoinensis]